MCTTSMVTTTNWAQLAVATIVLGLGCNSGIFNVFFPPGFPMYFPMSCHPGGDDPASCGPGGVDPSSSTYHLKCFVHISESSNVFSFIFSTGSNQKYSTRKST